MEPVEKFIKCFLLLALMSVLFIVAIVFDEFAGKGWAGLGIFVIGAIAGGMVHMLWKEFKK